VQQGTNRSEQSSKAHGSFIPQVRDEKQLIKNENKIYLLLSHFSLNIALSLLYSKNDKSGSGYCCPKFKGPNGLQRELC
jgi:hypothetical protein